MKTPSTTKAVAAIFLIIFGLSLHLKGQDMHFTQFHASPLLVNPALAGAFYGNHRFAGILRNQWSNVPVNYLSFSAAYDRKFIPKKLNARGYFSGGLVFDYDVAGDSRLNLTGLSLSAAYNFLITKRNALTFGIAIGGVQRAFKLNELQFDEQFVKFFDPGLPTGEVFQNDSKFYADVSAGLNFQHQVKNSRTQISLGTAVFHFNRPNNSFREDVGVKLVPRFTVYGMATVMLSKKFDFILQAMGQFQKPHQETIFGAYGRLHLNQRPTRELALQLGGFYRIRDAVAPAIGLLYKDWEAGFSYDINLSDFEEASLSNGGPEIFVRYHIRQAPDQDYCPLCPKHL